ncbi:HAMP domain-containing histidine kinase [Nocardioides cavernae]|uniref:histidine kinase n=1 Tax=Nocardioides cavernae TaxID=1921566 RepID=A0ABR8N4W7_9ACTN|nr:HAMP domain-containing sensor histidine kinase [Nocardioides cavernae]MBD3923210.1 HAMP domain-containing histidine kinase [Nocardioides cavernae]MBM7511869.1 two-component system OmpR family sensor kinase [Nocardioides cavernae]
MTLRPRRPLTLTARLVAVVVLLVAVSALLIGTATTLAMQQNLDRRLDADVRDAARFAAGPRHPDRDGDDFGPGQQFGSLQAYYPDAGASRGLVLSEQEGDGWSASTALDEAELAAMEALGAARDPQTVDLPDLGSYRVLVTDVPGGTFVAGLPRSEVEETVERLVQLELLTGLLGVLAAAGVGMVVVRRQLSPLREVAATAHRVAELPLASGEIEMADRVPERLTDERTEVGQVGSALNAMLDHVEHSLGQRHRSEQQVRQFVADASHELRTPLATIAGYTELARHRPETGGTALAKVETESARMTALVEDLLLLARLDSGRPLERRAVDLSRLLLEAVDDARVVDPDRSWRLSLPDEPITVTGDEARLHQVVSNLLANARKHTPPGSTVTITGTAGAAGAGFTVHDDGPGFAPDLAPRAFERFTRGDAARTRGGAGLGLSLVEAIVGAHGGAVTLDSRPGDTTITVVLPSPSA